MANPRELSTFEILAIVRAVTGQPAVTLFDRTSGVDDVDPRWAGHNGEWHPIEDEGGAL